MNPGPLLLLAQSRAQARLLDSLIKPLAGHGLDTIAVGADHLRRPVDRASDQWRQLGRPHLVFPYRRIGTSLVRRGRRKFRPLPPPRTIDCWLDAIGPSVVVVGNDARPTSEAVLSAARRVGTRTALIQDGVRLERFGVGPPERYGLGGCDRVVVMSDRFAAQLESRGVEPGRIVRGGFPPWDDLADPGHRAAVAARPLPFALDDRPLVVYASQPFGLPIDRRVASFVAVADGASDAGARFVLKSHPRDLDHDELAGRLLEARPDAIATRDAPLEPLLGRAAALVTVYSTVALEAMFYDVPVVVDETVDHATRLGLDEATLVARDLGALRAAVTEAVGDRNCRRRIGEVVPRVLEHETHSTDGRAGERVAAALAELACGAGGAAAS